MQKVPDDARYQRSRRPLSVSALIMRNDVIRASGFPWPWWVFGIAVGVAVAGAMATRGAVDRAKHRLEHTCERVIFQWIADQITREAPDVQEAVVRLLGKVHDAVRLPPSGKSLGDVEPLDILTAGRGFCDQQANVLAQLVRTIPLDVRLAFLRDGKGQSPHSIAEVYLNGAWRIVDPLLGVPILNAQGQLATHEEVARDPSLLTNHPFVLASVALGSTTDFAEMARWYQDPPIVFNTWRGKRKMWMDHCPAPLRRWVVYRFQDLYWLLSASHRGGSRWQHKLLRARHYALAGRVAQAERLYQRLIGFAEEPDVREDARFFLARLYQDQQRWQDALTMWTELLREHPETGWSTYAQLAIGQVEEALGHPAQALAAYQRSHLMQQDLIVGERVLALEHVQVR